MLDKRWLELLLYLPLLLFLIITNIYQDPANIFHDESKEIAKTLVDGKAAYSATGNGNEREVKHNLIKYMPDHVDCIAVGPSLVMCVNKDIVGTDSFVNLGVSGADMYDILAQFGLMEIYGKDYDRVIFCVDSYFFDESIYNNNVINTPLMPYSEYMLSILNGDSSLSEIKEENNYFMMLEQVFSLSYFQASWDQICLNNKFSMTENRWGVVDGFFDGSKPYYGTDGSWTYAASYQANDENYVINQSIQYDLDGQFKKDGHMSEYSAEVFEKLISYLSGKGVEVELYLCPVAPTLWDRLEANKEQYQIIGEIDNYSRDIAYRYDLKLVGSYNPYDLSMKDSDFYDARHIRRELLGYYFDFTE